MSGSPYAAVRYSGVAIILHWMIATLIAINLALGLRTNSLRGLAQFELVQWHKSIGVTVLILSVARLGWRLLRRPPAEPWSMGVWQRRAAAAVHWAFYGLMLGLPLSGWVMVSASRTNIPTLLYKRLPWPHIAAVHDLAMPVRRQVEDLAHGAHQWLTYAAYALIALHLAAVAKHQVFDRDATLYRMAPLRRLIPRPTKET